jgi:serine/threonine protein kinase
VLKGSYRITAVLGEGGMGVVYRGEHLSLPCQVAIKTLLPKAIASSESRERFEREAAIAARLNHPGVTQVYDYAGHRPRQTHVDGCGWAARSCWDCSWWAGWPCWPLPDRGRR